MKARRELNATSSQDEFAKWAKLRRTHDKLLEKLETSSKQPSITYDSHCVLPRAPILCLQPLKETDMPNIKPFFTEKSLESSQAKFNNYLNGVRLLLTRAPQYVVPFWYSKEPMFWLPYGLFPYYAEWFLSLPRAPLGSVSIVSWQVACSIFIRLIAELIGSVLKLYTTSRIHRNTAKKAAPIPAKPRPAKEQVSEKVGKAS
jgi:hypothetical protein